VVGAIPSLWDVSSIPEQKKNPQISLCVSGGNKGFTTHSFLNIVVHIFSTQRQAPECDKQDVTFATLSSETTTPWSQGRHSSSSVTATDGVAGRISSTAPFFLEPFKSLG
jgi:hypothetical protein